MARFEKKNDESNPKFQDWIEKITDPSFSLIPSLLDYFLDEMTPQETREKICKLLVKLMILQEETVTEQLLATKNFPIVCVQFITKGDKSNSVSNSYEEKKILEISDLMDLQDLNEIICFIKGKYYRVDVSKAKYFNIPYDRWISAIEKTVKEKFVEMNKKAFNLGYNS